MVPIKLGLEGDWTDSFMDRGHSRQKSGGRNTFLNMEAALTTPEPSCAGSSRKVAGAMGLVTKGSKGRGDSVLCGGLKHRPKPDCL
jgi:hypothetical protein